MTQMLRDTLVERYVHTCAPQQVEQQQELVEEEERSMRIEKKHVIRRVLSIVGITEYVLINKQTHDYNNK